MVAVAVEKRVATVREQRFRARDRRRDASAWWNWHPSNTALEFLWRTGALANDRREGFQKVFDLADRVIPAAVRAAVQDERETLA